MSTENTATSATTSRYDLTGKIAAVTGAASGLGRDVALELAAAGSTVALLDVDDAGLLDTLDALTAEKGQQHIFMHLDISNREAVNDTFDKIAADLGSLDVLVNAAGITERDPGTLTVGAEDWDRVLAVNLTGTFNCCRAAAAGGMAAGGSIVNIASVTGMAGFGQRPAYTASKAGVIGLTRSLAKDLAHIPIRVNALAPGVVRTPMTEDAYWARPEDAEALMATLPMGKLVTPHAIATSVLYLSSGMSDFVTGAILPVDGGVTATRSRGARLASSTE